MNNSKIKSILGVLVVMSVLTLYFGMSKANADPVSDVEKKILKISECLQMAASSSDLDMSLDSSDELDLFIVME